MLYVVQESIIGLQIFESTGKLHWLYLIHTPESIRTISGPGFEIERSRYCNAGMGIPCFRKSELHQSHILYNSNRGRDGPLWTMKSPSGYVTSVRNNPRAGTDWPEAHRFSAARIVLNSSTLVLPLPTSTRVPTIALTIFLKKRSAEIVNT